MFYKEEICKKKTLVLFGIGKQQGKFIKHTFSISSLDRRCQAVTFFHNVNRLIYNNTQQMKMDKTLTLGFVKYQQEQLKIIGQYETILVIHQNGVIEQITVYGLAHIALYTTSTIKNRQLLCIAENSH